MGLFKKLFSILQGDSEEKDIENLSGTSNSQETNCSEEKKHQAKSKVKKEVSKTSQEPIREQKEFYTNEIENSDKESVNLEELSLEELEEMQKKLEVDGKEARRRGDKKAEEKLHSEWQNVRYTIWKRQSEKKAEKGAVEKSQKTNSQQPNSHSTQIEDSDKKEVNLEELSLEELEKMQEKLFVDIQKARLREDKEAEKEMYSEWRKVRSAVWIKEREKKAKEETVAKAKAEEAAAKAKAEEEAAAKEKAEEEAATKEKAEEEAATKEKAEEEAAAKEKAEEEAVNPTLVDSEIANQLTDGGKNKNVILPASVCEIAPNAFYDNKTLERIDMTSCNKLTIIGELAFAGCENLTNIIFPENIEEIGGTAFSNCEALASVDLSNCKKLDKIGESAFNWCPSLEEVLLPESLSSIGKSAFCGCKIRNIDFSACKLLSKFPDNLFNMCKSLEEVVWPPHLKEIGDVAFSDCESLRRVELPDSVEVLGEQIFSGCKLKSLSLPKNIKKLPVLTVALRAEAQIKSLDMSRCKKLKVLTAPITCSSKTIVFPVGVEEIEADVFKYNFKHGQFESIFLPPTIKEVELNNSADEANVYCYAPELENVKDIIEKCACLLVLPQYYDSYYDQAVAEGAEGYLDKIPEDKLYFYDE
ncbi:leucine-rich repeat domain-containing protein [Segatella copri]|uniref:leucine-rich repeat domain-containing protein n=1 Tax=Segatella copri TaxID=165179 RepID=UPI003F8C93FA